MTLSPENRACSATRERSRRGWPRSSPGPPVSSSSSNGDQPSPRLLPSSSTGENRTYAQPPRMSPATRSCRSRAARPVAAGWSDAVDCGRVPAIWRAGAGRAGPPTGGSAPCARPVGQRPRRTRRRGRRPTGSVCAPVPAGGSGPGRTAARSCGSPRSRSARCSGHRPGRSGWCRAAMRQPGTSSPRRRSPATSSQSRSSSPAGNSAAMAPARDREGRDHELAVVPERGPQRPGRGSTLDPAEASDADAVEHGQLTSGGHGPPGGRHAGPGIGPGVHRRSRP